MKLKSIFFIILLCCFFNSFTVEAHSSMPIKSFTETARNGNILNVSVLPTGTKITVYKEADNKTYHLSSCKQNSDYSRPCRLSEIIMDGTRCAQCIDDKLYYSCRESIYRIELESLSKNKQMQARCNGILIITLIILIAMLFKKYRQH